MPDANLEALTFGPTYLHRLRLHTETTEKTRLHGLFRDLTLKEWQRVFHSVAVVNSLADQNFPNRCLRRWPGQKRRESDDVIKTKFVKLWG